MIMSICIAFIAFNNFVLLIYITQNCPSILNIKNGRFFLFNPCGILTSLDSPSLFCFQKSVEPPLTHVQEQLLPLNGNVLTISCRELNVTCSINSRSFFAKRRLGQTKEAGRFPGMAGCVTIELKHSAITTQFVKVEF